MVNEGHEGTREAATVRWSGRAAAALVIAAAAVAELSLFLHWRVPPAENMTSIFGSVDRESMTIHRLGTSGWSVKPVAGVLLTALGVLALGTVGLMLRRGAPPRSLVAVLGGGAVAGVVFCVVTLSSGPALEAVYVLRGYGATAYSGVFASRVDHGVGVSVMLAASVGLIVGAIGLGLLTRSSVGHGSPAWSSQPPRGGESRNG